MELWTAFVIGIAGSFHCVGMCGPLAMALPVGGSTGLVTGRLLYNFGRIITYALLGGVLGALGMSFALFGFQQGLSVVAGILLLVMALLSFQPGNSTGTPGFMRGVQAFVKKQLGRWLQVKSAPSYLMIGMLNGLLPCGFVYFGLTGAVTTGDVFTGMAYMTFFGLGTFPVMLATSLAGSFINLRLRNTVRKLSGVVMLVFAVLLIVRGLNLDIPYLSPQLDAKSEVVKCHH